MAITPTLVRSTKVERSDNPDLTSYCRVFDDVSRFRFGLVDAKGTASLPRQREVLRSQRVERMVEKVTGR